MVAVGSQRGGGEGGDSTPARAALYIPVYIFFLLLFFNKNRGPFCGKV